MARVMVIGDSSMDWERTRELRALSQSYAAYLGEPVEFIWARPELAALARDAVEPMPGDPPVETLQPFRVQTEGMPAAALSVDAEGRPDWGATWESFCELAFLGGPPHRGDEAMVRAIAEIPRATPEGEFDAIAEIRRGIFLTTGLFSEPAAQPGWLAVSCRTPKHAAWICACIILENVEARVDDEGRLLVPASPSFTLKDQVKSVITVVAKVHHYWEMHAVVYGIE